MSAVATNIQGNAKRLQIGAAAMALAAAAVITPVMATADTDVCAVEGSVECSTSLGTMAGSEFLAAANSNANADGEGISILWQNALIWFGKPPSPGKAPVVLWEAYNYNAEGFWALIPGLKELMGLLTSNLDYNGCILGATVKIGPYFNASGSLTQGCSK